MEGFTLGLALVDAIPVLSFGVSMVIIAGRFRSPLFLVGAALSVLAGCCKVAWKLVLGITKKDLRWLNKPFVPMMRVRRPPHGVKASIVKLAVMPSWKRMMAT